MARALRQLNYPGLKMGFDGQGCVVAEVERPQGQRWIKVWTVLLEDKRLSPTHKVILIALANGRITSKELSERFGLSRRHVQRTLADFQHAHIAFRNGRYWTLTAWAKQAWEKTPWEVVEEAARGVAPKCRRGGAKMSLLGAQENRGKCSPNLAETVVRPCPSLDKSLESVSSKDAAAAASSPTQFQLEERRSVLHKQLEEARKPATERFRRHVLAFCRVNGGSVGNILAAAVHAYWEEVNTATARRLKALLEVRLAAMVREVAAAEGPKRHQVARAHVRSAMEEAREDARDEIQGLGVQLERVTWELEARMEAAEVRVFGAAGSHYEEAPGRKVLAILEQVAVEARAAWVPPGREPVEVECRAAFWEARRERVLARLAAEAGPPAPVPPRGEKARPLEGLVRGLFQLRELILNPPNLPMDGLS